MTYRKILLAIGASALAPAILAAPAAAQGILGSGVAPAAKENSAERPIAFAALAPEGGVLVILTSRGELPDLSGVILSSNDRSNISRAIADAKFDGAKSSTLSLRGVGPYARLLLIGTGPAPTKLDWQISGGIAARELATEDHPVTIAGHLDQVSGSEVATGFGLGQYRFDRYLAGSAKPVPTSAVTIVSSNSVATKALFDGRGAPLVHGARLSRNLSSEPANVIYPESFVAHVRAAFAGIAGISIEVLDEAAMRKLGMGALVGVGQGSPRGSRLLAVRYRGAGTNSAPTALVGKGITFDSGGLSLKGGDGMINMKGDMSGAAAVMGATLSLAKSRAPVNVVAVAALAENMPDGNAQRPGDVVRTLSGKTIEMTNADAEGRLVLADANEYVARQYHPRAIINIATLTGTAVSAVGNQYGALFTRTDEMANRLIQSGATSGEKLWRLPLDKAYFDYIRSDIADIRNSSTSGGPGASLGALFIEHFVDPNIDWAHLDIAGMFRSDKNAALTPKGMTGYGVRLLDQYMRDAR